MRLKKGFEKIVRLFKGRLLLIGLLCAFLPLVLLLLVQYQSLSQTERKSAFANTLLLQSYLESIAAEINYAYRLEAERALSIPVSILDDEKFAGAYFAKQKWNGAKFYFTLSVENESALRFFPVRTDAEISDVVKNAFAKLRENALNKNDLTVDENNPNNRLILKPLFDESGKFIGAAGLILDNDYFVNQSLPSVIKEKRAKFFQDGFEQSVIVTVFDGNNRLILASQPVGGADENVSVPFQFVFKDWQLRIQNSVVTQKDWSRKIFWNNILLSILLAAFLLLVVVISLRAAKKQMQLSQMKSDFVANVTHELRTPLTSIRVFGELMNSGWIDSDEKLRECGTHIENEARRLTLLVDNILDFSRIEAGQKQYHFERGDVQEIVGETLQTLEPQLRQKGYAIDFEKSEESLPTVNFDRDAIKQVLVNLIDNAVKYSPDEEQIAVSLSKQNGGVIIQVRDWGIGIAPSEREKIFEKFHRVGNNLTHDVKGSGLGLAIVRHIVSAHRGRIEVESEREKGSIFTVYLPKAEDLKGGQK